jgi:hypothetical protein
VIKIIACGYEITTELKERFYQSLEMQSVGSFEVYDRSEVHYPHRYYLMENTVEGVNMANCKDDDILIFADMDDFFCSDNAIKIIEDTYAENSNLLLTYGSYFDMKTQEKGKFCGEYQEDECFRTAPWRASHLKTMKYKLFRSIPLREFKDNKCVWVKCATDRALMLPALELAGFGRIRHIEEILYCYCEQENSVWKTNREQSLRIREYIHSSAPMMIGEF